MRQSAVKLAPERAAEARSPRLAVQIADRIAAKIVSAKWPVGHRIGQEAELTAEYGVARWTLRDAIRILESTGLVERRKGGGGGLFVASTTSQSIQRLGGNYLAFRQVSAEEFIAVQEVIYGFGIRRAQACRSEVLRRELCEMFEAMPGKPLAEQLDLCALIFDQVVKMAGNPAHALMAGILANVIYESITYSSFDDEDYRDHLSGFPPILAETARLVLDQAAMPTDPAVQRYSALCGAFYHSSNVRMRRSIEPTKRDRAFVFYPPARPLKKVEIAEREIGEMIYRAGWEVGANLGTEAQLAKRLNVGRWVLREALRALEQLGVVEVGRGTRSGVRIVAPEPSAVVAACRKDLERAGLTRAHQEETMEALDHLLPGFGGSSIIGDLFRAIVASEPHGAAAG